MKQKEPPSQKKKKIIELINSPISEQATTRSSD